MVESVYPTQTVVRESSAARVVFEETVEFESPNGWRSEVTSRLTIRRKDVRPPARSRAVPPRLRGLARARPLHRRRRAAPAGGDERVPGVAGDPPTVRHHRADRRVCPRPHPPGRRLSDLLRPARLARARHAAPVRALLPHAVRRPAPPLLVPVSDVQSRLCVAHAALAAPVADPHPPDVRRRARPDAQLRPPPRRLTPSGASSTSSSRTRASPTTSTSSWPSSASTTRSARSSTSLPCAAHPQAQPRLGHLL